jgi:hypothetical protein
MKAIDLEPGDDFIMKLACRVLSVESVGATHVRVRIAVEDQPSISFGYDENPIEFVCRKSRWFNSPWHGGGGGAGNRPVEPVRPIILILEFVK